MNVGTNLSGKQERYEGTWSRKECSGYGERMCSKIITRLHENALWDSAQ